MRSEVFTRDENRCVYCGEQLPSTELTIDHLVPVALGGLDEMTNWATCCKPCNQRKAAVPLDDFLASLGMQVAEIPIHGDPVIDNTELPLELRAIRKGIFERIRRGELTVSGKSAQKKIEKEYRRDLWQTPQGKMLEADFPNLPGHVRAMIPEIRTIAKSVREFLLLVELAKSAHTRNLLGSIITPATDVEERVRSMYERERNPTLKKRLGWVLRRFEKTARKAESRLSTDAMTDDTR